MLRLLTALPGQKASLDPTIDSADPKLPLSEFKRAFPGRDLSRISGRRVTMHLVVIHKLPVDPKLFEVEAIVALG